MTPEELVRIWRELPSPREEALLEAREMGVGLWAAVDAQRRVHLLIQVPPGSEAPPQTTHGLSMTVTVNRIPERVDASYLDLTCLSEAGVSTFAAVAAELCSTLGPISPPARLDAVADALVRWRWFWGMDSSALSPEDAVGLFGELWFLLRWIDVNAETVAGWTGADPSTHDFQWPAYSVEVKASAVGSVGNVSHTINGLLQLDEPSVGTLYLFSLHLQRDDLAANTLPVLVDRIRALLRLDPATLHVFLSAIADRGYSPAHAHHHERRYRVLAEELYRVDGDFPRLTASSFPDGLPAGVSNIRYSLAMSACSYWLTATRPEDASWRGHVQGS